MSMSITRQEIANIARRKGIKVYSSLDEYIIEKGFLLKEQWVFMSETGLEHYRPHCVEFFERNSDIIEFATENGFVCFKYCVHDDPLSHIGAIGENDGWWKTLGESGISNTGGFKRIDVETAKKRFPNVRLLVEFTDHLEYHNGGKLTNTMIHEAYFEEIEEIFCDEDGNLRLRGYGPNRNGKVFVADEDDPRLEGVYTSTVTGILPK